MTEQKITLELTLEELKLLDKYVEKTDDTYSVLMKIKDAYPSQKSPAEEAYKEIYGDYPMGEPFWIVFKKGYEAAEKSKVEPSLINCVLEGNPPNGYSSWSEWFEELGSKGILHNLKISSKDFDDKPYCPDEPEHYDEVEWDEKDNPKPVDEVVERLVKEHQAQKLWNQLEELGYSDLHCDEIVDLVEDWIPEYQNASSSQNVNTELLVEGFNDAIRKMKEMLS